MYLALGAITSVVAESDSSLFFVMVDAGERPCVPAWLEHAETVIAVASLVLNLVLALLVVYRTPIELRVYSRVLMTNCIMDVVFTFTVVLFQLVSISLQGLRYQVD